MIYDGSVSHDMVQLRPATPDDLPQVQALHQEAYLCNSDALLGLTPEVMYRHVYGADDGHRLPFGERILVNYNQWLANSQARFTVADMDGSAVGYATVVNYDTVSLLDGLYVNPALHGRGIGALLLRHAESVAVRPLRLWAVEHAPARDFYKKRGYEDTLSQPQTISIVGGYVMQLIEMRQGQL